MSRHRGQGPNLLRTVPIVVAAVFTGVVVAAVALLALWLLVQPGH